MGTKHTPRERKMRNEGLRRFRRRDAAPAIDTKHAVMDIYLVPEAILVRGAVVMARVAFTEGNDYKARPVVITAVSAGSVEVRPCTSSQLGLRRAGNLLLTDLATAGLSRATAVRPDAITIPLTDIVGAYGRLSGQDMSRVFGRRLTVTAA